MSVFYDERARLDGVIAARTSGHAVRVTIDFDTLGEKPELLDTITLRERDTMQQTRVKISELLPLLLGRSVDA